MLFGLLVKIIVLDTRRKLFGECCARLEIYIHLTWGLGIERAQGAGKLIVSVAGHAASV